MSSHSVADLTVFNALGESADVTFEFTNNSATTAGSWTVTVTDAEGNTLHTGEIRFGDDGTPAEGFNQLSFDLTDSNGGTSTVTVDFGEPGSFANATSVSGGQVSTLGGSVEDGYGISALTTIDFTADGTLTLNYANGESLDGPRLGLATFSNPSTLELVEGSVFRAGQETSVVYGNPTESGMGNIIAESIELSNVDLSREFADMIIIQRGYQASSRILNVANQLLDQLYENTRGR